MSTRAAAAVRCLALLSVLTSGFAWGIAYRGGHPLPPQTVDVAVIAAGAAAMCVLLQHRMPANNLWRVLVVVAVNGSVAVLLYATASTATHPSGVLVGLLWLSDAALAVPWMLFAGLFPDGHRPVPYWSRLVVAGTVVLAAVSFAAWLTAPTGAPVPIPGHLPGAVAGPSDGSLHAVLELAASLLAGLLPLMALGAAATRYRRSGPVVRQQIRVGFVGLAITVLLQIALQILPGAGHGRTQLVVAVVSVGVGQLAVAAALLRWRLWLVDQALPRAVVLGACSAAFTAVLVAGALLVTGQVGKSQVRVAVVAAAVVTALVQGYSRRLEPWVHRLVYGHRPSGFGVLVGLADGLASLDDLAAASRIVEAARRGLSVPWAVLWTSTARRGVYRLVAVAGEVSADTVIADVEPVVGVPVRLLRPGEDAGPWPGDAAALAVLGAAEPWALLCVGQRRGDPLTTADLELLAAVGRESELARANRRLTERVEVTVEALQARAAELQVSRQRLVSAQDEERRRIERDLHDGAQHELITLAVELRQLARGSTRDPQTLDELAGRAERAVFSLQDLARGIYPSVLTDRGVPAAIRSFAGAVPAEVVLEIAPDLAVRRWSPALETALYFVAVEALGNSQKHAHAGRTTVTLSERDGAVVLEVYDDGDGFDGSAVPSGSGLQHMADRMSALGGDLVVDGRPGEGTWVIATAPAGRPTSATPVSDPSPTPSNRAAPLAPGG